NNLYRNDSAPEGTLRFVDVAPGLNGQDQASGMSVSWGDANRDGRMDLYVGNMFSSAGRRIATQGAFSAGSPEDVRRALLRFARGNTLLLNRGDRFEDVSEPSGVTMGRWAWSSSFADLNNDGWEDLVVANGYLTTGDTGDL
ncbi:MAG: VCBS repeat-containing protein, partial [Akkermansiaceae bacterium]|nr:VCBS repeat-containing protein [Akkermansiaceae bacterium]